MVANQNFEFEHSEQLIAWQFNRNSIVSLTPDAEVDVWNFCFITSANPVYSAFATGH
ncbi:hypothetical protein D3C81_1797420 [compost metagenome]